MSLKNFQDFWWLILNVLEREGGCYHWVREKQRGVEQRKDVKQDFKWRKRHE